MPNGEALISQEKLASNTDLLRVSISCVRLLRWAEKRDPHLTKRVDDGGNVVTLAETNDENIEFLTELLYLVSAPFLTIRFVFVSLKAARAQYASILEKEN